jgi:hypothetical protein
METDLPNTALSDQVRQLRHRGRGHEGCFGFQAAEGAGRGVADSEPSPKPVGRRNSPAAVAYLSPTVATIITAVVVDDQESIQL